VASHAFDIEIANETDSAVDLERIVDTARYVMNFQNLHADTELAISLVDLAEMERLHIEYMDEPGATDVLSFEMDELRAPNDDIEAEPGILGDVVLCPEFAAPQAEQAGHSLADELDLLVTHGILHLLGHDHAEPEEHAVMFGLQATMLKALKDVRGEK
jgi:probable rRNA maturation factor